jgi:malate dehydrogenase
MIDVAIVGAGELGGALAHRLARSGAASMIRLIDERGRIAAGKALDIAEAAPVEGFSTQLAGSTDITAAAGAAVIVLADRAAGSEWQGDEGLMLLGQIARTKTRAIVLCAGAAQRELVERGVAERHLARARLLGSAPGALAAAVRAMIALEANSSPHDVALTILGVPPGQIVIPWEETTIGGFSATRALGEPARRRIAAMVPALWPPGPYALAAAAALAIDAITGRSRRLTTCFVAPDTTAGARVRTAALPVRLGPGGLVEVVLPELSAHDRTVLDNAMML